MSGFYVVGLTVLSLTFLENYLEIYYDSYSL